MTIFDCPSKEQSPLKYSNNSLYVINLTYGWLVGKYLMFYFKIEWNYEVIKIIVTSHPSSWILTFHLAQCSNYDRGLHTMKSDHFRLILEMLDNLGTNWTKQTIYY